MRLRIAHIQPDPSQPRKIFAPGPLDELARSIEMNGLETPISVSKGAGRNYLINAGERRWRAHGLLVERGLSRFAWIEARVDRERAAPVDVRLRQIAENLTREDLKPMEEARAFRALVDDFDLDESTIAARLGLAPFRVRWRLSLLNLAPEIAALVEADQLDRQQALEIARVTSHDRQRDLVRAINRGDLVGWKATRNAVEAIESGMTQVELFGAAAARPSAADVETLAGMERKVEAIVGLVAAGWRDGECRIASMIDPGRAGAIAEKLALIRTHVGAMERQLRQVQAQAVMVLS